MSVIYFREIAQGRSGSDSVNAQSGEQTYVRMYRAKTDSNTDTAATVLASASCPTYGSAHPSNAYAYVKSRRATQETHCDTFWIVQIDYSTSSRQYQSSPLSDPAEITWRSEQFQRVAYKDTDGNAIVNSASDFYDPPPERDDSRWVATITKKVAAVPYWLLSYQDAINDGPFVIDGLTVEKHKAKIQDIQISRWDSRDGVRFRTLTISMTMAKDGFELELLDQGFNKLDGDDQVKIKIEDDDGESVEPTGPVLLDGSGGVLSSPSPANAVFRSHDVYEEKNFNMLPLT